MLDTYFLTNLIRNKNKNENDNEEFSEGTTSSININITENVNPILFLIIVIIIIILFISAYRLSYNGKKYDRHFGWGFANFIMLILFPGEFIFYHIGVTSGLKWVLNGNDVVAEGWHKGSIEEALINFKNKGSPLLKQNSLVTFSEV